MGRPCFMLHPCQTAELLDLMLPSLRQRRCTSSRVAAAPINPSDQPSERPEGQRQPETAGSEAGIRSIGSDGDLQGSKCWQGRYMAAWWSVVGPALGLPRPASHGGAVEDGV